MKHLYTLLLLATLGLSYSPAIATDQETPEQSKATLFVEDLEMEIAQKNPGRRYHPTRSLIEEEAKRLQEIMSTFDPNYPPEFSYHRGRFKSIVQSLSKIPQQLIDDKNINGKLFNFSVPNVPLDPTKFPNAYDMVIRYHADDGNDHYINVKLSNNVYIPKN